MDSRRYMDISDWPRPSEEELPEMYEDIDEMVHTARTLLREHFTIEGPGEQVQFGDATAEDYMISN